MQNPGSDPIKLARVIRISTSLLLVIINGITGSVIIITNKFIAEVLHVSLYKKTFKINLITNLSYLKLFGCLHLILTWLIIMVIE